MTRRRGGMEVLPFGGRGFLRVHGHERCLLAARWPRDHRRRRNRTESCCFSLSLFLTLLSLSLSAVCLERRGLLPPLLLLLLVLFPPPLPPLSVSLVLLLRGEEKDGGRDSGERREKKKEQQLCSAQSGWTCVSAYVNVCVCEQIAESSNVSWAPLLMPQPPSSLPFLPSFPLLFHLASLSFTFPAPSEAPLVSFSSLCFLPLWCRWLNWPMSWIHRLSIHSVCLPPSMYPSLPPLSVCWLCQAFCSSAQQQSPERAGVFHFAHRQRGVGLSRQQEN